jgi:transcriptional regulator
MLALDEYGWTPAFRMLGLTQEEIAEKLKLARTTMQDMERAAIQKMQRRAQVFSTEQLN